MKILLTLTLLLGLAEIVLASDNSISEREATNIVNFDGYVLPTAIPSQLEDRFKLINKMKGSENLLDLKAVYLTHLALLTSQTTSSIEQVEALQSKFEALRADLPEDPELMAAHGSLIAYKSIFYLDNLSTLSILSRQGNRLMDRAVKLNPKHLGARLQRGIACANMPSYVRRARYAVQDLELLKQKVGNKFGTEFNQFVNYYLALAYSRNQQVSDARELWRHLSTGENEWSQKSKLALKEL